MESSKNGNSNPETVDISKKAEECLIKFRVRYYETDAMGIVHHSNYLRWFELGRTEYLRQAGMPYRKMEEEGISCPVISINCKYHHPARYDDEIELKTWVSDYGGTRLVMAYVVKCNDRLLCSGESQHAFIWQNRPAAPKRSLPDLHALLEQCRLRDQISE